MELFVGAKTKRKKQQAELILEPFDKLKINNKIYLLAKRLLKEYNSHSKSLFMPDAFIARMKKNRREFLKNQRLTGLTLTRAGMLKSYSATNFPLLDSYNSAPVTFPTTFSLIYPGSFLLDTIRCGYLDFSIMNINLA